MDNVRAAAAGRIQDERHFSQLPVSEQIRILESFPPTTHGIHAFRTHLAYKSQFESLFVLIRGVAELVRGQVLHSSIVLAFAVILLLRGMSRVPPHPMLRFLMVALAAVCIVFIVAGIIKTLDAEEEFSLAVSDAYTQAKRAEMAQSAARTREGWHE